MNQNMKPYEKEFLGHPVGLYFLFFTELWERFSYYGMRAILVLYLVAQTGGENPGLGWSNESAIALYGWYTMFVYVATIPGGLLADKILGERKSVMIGGLLLCIGHSVLAIEHISAFYTGLAFIVLGVGCLKGNISSMVGGLYKKLSNDKRDMGFYIFYMGINIGAAAASLLVGYVGEEHGWHYGFGLAGIGMAIGQLFYWRGQKYLSHVGNVINIDKKSSGNTNLITKIFEKTNSTLGFFLTIALGLLIYLYWGSWSYGLLVTGLAFAVGIAIVIYNDGSKIEKDRILVTYIAFLMIIVFWGAFEQAGGLLNLYAKQKTNLVLTENFTVPASWFQSLNAIFIIIFASIVGSFWVWWQNKGNEYSGIFKMAIGVIIMGWGFFFMSAASGEVQYSSSGDIVEKSAMYWLVLAYLFHTIGELCASPVALSFITKLSPARWSAFMMGAYFAVTGLGNKVAGLIGENASEIGEYWTFTGIAIFCTLFGLLFLFLVKPLKRLIHDAE
ncbi:MAG: MFS transporter [Flavobacteriaceae bacterium]|nr:MFS transporter [Flavobacteriaceae bacterium]